MKVGMSSRRTVTKPSQGERSGIVLKNSELV
jgi:hypothetical protein